jgi:putative Holliday junction resolvase
MAAAAIAQSGMKKAAQKNKQLIDTVAATIILQSYLEKKSLGF